METYKSNFILKRVYFFALLITFIFLYSQVYSNEKIVQLNNKKDTYSIYSSLYWYSENKKQVSFEEVQKKDFPFILNQVDKVPNLGFTKDNYWFRFKIHNSNGYKKLILEIPYPFLNNLELYFVSSMGTIKKEKIGDHYVFDERKIKNKNFLYELSFFPSEEVTVFAHIECDGEATSFPVRLIKSLKLSEYYYQEQFVLGLYYGIIIFGLFLSIFLATFLNERTNFWYFLYILSVGIFQFSLDGLSFQYFWPNNTWLANHIIPLSGSAAVFFLIKFSQYLLRTKINTPKLCKTLNGISFVIVVFFVASFFGNPFYSISLKALNFIAVISNILILIAAIIIYRKKYPPARYFLIAFSVLLTGITIATLKNFGLLPRIFITEFGIQMGSAIEIIFFSFALSERVKILKGEKEIVQQKLLEQLQENNRIQAEINIELEKKVQERTLEITHQNEIIKEKNKDITDSINYAKRIQESLLPKDEISSLNTDNFFVLYKPRDIVSGDFYWYAQKQDKTIICAADCTGHGVPGALMSMIGTTLLKQLIDESSTLDAAQMLTILDKRIIEVLKQQTELNPNKDGMDMALCILDEKNKSITFAGASRPMLLIRNKEISSFDSSIFSLGGYNGGIDKNFFNHKMDLQIGDVFYLFSDGYADQFGGPKNKKLMIKNFKNLLMDVSHMAPAEQKIKIEEYYVNWQGSNEQVDDVLVMGYKFNG